MFNYPTSMKLREGNVFTRVCLSFITARKKKLQEDNVFTGVCRSGGGVGISGPMFLPSVGMYLWYQVLSGVYLGKWVLTPPYMGYYGIRSTSRQYTCYLNAFFSSLLTGTGVPCDYYLDLFKPVHFGTSVPCFSPSRDLPTPSGTSWKTDGWSRTERPS